MKKNFCILSIDGGGLKGLIAVKILKIIRDILGSDVSERCGLLAGTSTGGLISSALAVGEKGKAKYSLEHIEDMYITVGQSLFTGNGISFSGDESQRFDAILRDTFGETRLDETIRPVFVPAWDTIQHNIVVFKTRSARSDPSKNAFLRDICRATSAIPPVFPPYAMEYGGRRLKCLDAGIHLKNPAISALAEVWKHKEWYGVIKEEDITLLSISTGSYYGGRRDWTTDIHEILHTQAKDMAYIEQQDLEINYDRLRFLRADLRLGGSPFSMAQLTEWLARIKKLSGDQDFAADVKKVFT